MALRPLLVVCAVAAAAGCENSAAEKIIDDQRDQCLGFPAAGTTLVEARRAFSAFESLPICRPGEDSGATGERVTRFSGDTCDHTGVVCDFGWCECALDSRLCGPNGCCYGCGVRVVPKDANQDGILDDDTVICGARFATEQPVPPFCVY